MTALAGQPCLNPHPLLLTVRHSRWSAPSSLDSSSATFPSATECYVPFATPVPPALGFVPCGMIPTVPHLRVPGGLGPPPHLGVPAAGVCRLRLWPCSQLAGPAVPTHLGAPARPMSLLLWSHPAAPPHPPLSLQPHSRYGLTLLFSCILDFRNLSPEEQRCVLLADPTLVWGVPKARGQPLAVPWYLHTPGVACAITTVSAPFRRHPRVPPR